MQELRQTLDVTAAVLAARRRTSGDVARLEKLLTERDNRFAESDTGAAVEADIALHRAIVEASHNAVYLEFYDSLLPRSGRPSIGTSTRPDEDSTTSTPPW